MAERVFTKYHVGQSYLQLVPVMAETGTIDKLQKQLKSDNKTPRPYVAILAKMVKAYIASPLSADDKTRIKLLATERKTTDERIVAVNNEVLTAHQAELQAQLDRSDMAMLGKVYEKIGELQEKANSANYAELARIDKERLAIVNKGLQAAWDVWCSETGTVDTSGATSIGAKYAFDGERFYISCPKPRSPFALNMFVDTAVNGLWAQLTGPGWPIALQTSKPHYIGVYRSEGRSPVSSRKALGWLVYDFLIQSQVTMPTTLDQVIGVLDVVNKHIELGNLTPGYNLNDAIVYRLVESLDQTAKDSSQQRLYAQFHLPEWEEGYPADEDETENTEIVGDESTE